MVSLKELGVECSYNSNKPKEFYYLVLIKPGTLKNPKQAKKYFTNVINAISKDAKSKGGLDNLTLSVDEEYLSNLQSVSQDLLSKAKEHKELRSDLDLIHNFDNAPLTPKAIIIGGAVVSGLAGLIWGYDQMTELATNAAEYMNNASYLWAPITGLTQLSISILGTAITTIIGCVGGVIGGGIILVPYIFAKTPLANKVARYQSLEQALSQAETSKNGTG